MLKIILCLIFSLIFTNITYSQVSIVAVVNGKPITSFELEQKIKLEKFLLKNIDDTTKQNKDFILQDLIDDKIKIEQATKMGVTIAKEDELHTKAFFKHFFKLEDEFDKISEKLNIDKKILDEKIKAEILWGKLSYGMLASSINITDNDINIKITEITKNKKEFVFDIVPFVFNDENHYNNVKDSISKITTCDSFISFAKTNGSGISGLKISIKDSEMDIKLFNAIHNLKVNKLSNKININGSDTVYFVCDKKSFIPSISASEKEQIKVALFQEKLQKLATDYFEKIKKTSSIEIKNFNDENFAYKNKENFCPVDIKNKI